jgi:autotransporter-associated beta strand protein
MFPKELGEFVIAGLRRLGVAAFSLFLVLCLRLGEAHGQPPTSGATPYWNGQHPDWLSTNAWTLQPGGSLTSFLSGDNDVFDDTAVSTAVNINLGNVDPVSVTFNNSNAAYTINGSRGIIGPAVLVKNGTGSLKIGNSNGYTGGTILNAGLLTVNNRSALGSGGLTINGGVLDTSGDAITVSTLSVAGGALDLGIGQLLTSDGAASLGGTLNISGIPSGPTELMAYGSVTGSFAAVNGRPAGYSLVYNATELDLVPTPAPEPSTLALLGVGAIGLLACGWRMRQNRFV